MIEPEALIGDFETVERIEKSTLRMVTQDDLSHPGDAEPRLPVVKPMRRQRQHGPHLHGSGRTFDAFADVIGGVAAFGAC